jgi:hypothetical protein
MSTATPFLPSTVPAAVPEPVIAHESPRSSLFPADIRERLAEAVRLFEGPLVGVAFPHTDASTLASCAAALEEATSEVARCKAALERAYEALAAQQADATLRVDRAHAYARVFAADAPALAREVERIAPPVIERRAQPRPSTVADRAIAPTAPRKRGRPPKTLSPLVVANPSNDVDVDTASESLVDA